MVIGIRSVSVIKEITSCFDYDSAVLAKSLVTFGQILYLLVNKVASRAFLATAMRLVFRTSDCKTGTAIY